MAKLPIDTRLKTEIKIEDDQITEPFRPYLGISGIGDPCMRKMWYGFRMCSERKFSPRQKRLFMRGHYEEPIIQKDLKKAGIICHVNQDNQPEVVCGNGHIKGHVDDVLTNVPDAPKTPHLGEYKTHNDKSFKDMKKKGLIKSKPTHYAQMVCYMYLMKLKRGLYVAVNKNDDSRYYERISENIKFAKELIKKGIDVISTEVPPPKIGNSTWYECKWCDYYMICHFGDTPLKNCRTCSFGDIHDEGIWKCAKYKIELAFQQQQLGCTKHILLKGLQNV
jgi:CRISPR/Cas system-associated exonuclease Cas4 (RecB family)